MVAIKSAVFRLSPRTKVALVSLAVGFFCAMWSVKVAQFVSRLAMRNGMYVEDIIDTSNDDDVMNRNDRNDDTLSWQPGELHAGGGRWRWSLYLIHLGSHMSASTADTVNKVPQDARFY